MSVGRPGRINPKATLSVRLGIGSLVLAFFGGFLLGIPAMAAGYAARRDINLSGGAEGGGGRAAVGILTGLIGTVISALFAASVAVGVWSDQIGEPERAWSPPTAVPKVDPSGLKPFYTQSLRWTDCGIGKCTRVKMPIDYAKPGGKTLQVAVKVVPALGPGGRKLFLNPGGPGASGIRFADYLAAKISPKVRRHYDLVNVDPRGVGESTPVDCVSNSAFAAFAASDPDPDTPAEIKDFREAHRQLGEGCKRRSGAVAAHVSTEEVARDFDVLRSLLGQRKLDWFGFSYGTAIGATYATLFPDRVGRMVLDGPVDPSESVIDAGLSQAVGFQRALRAYVADCTSRWHCPLGRSESKAMHRIAELLQRLDRYPLRTDDADRKLTQGLAFYGMAKPLYSKSTWVSLSNGFDAALQGDGSVLARLADAYFAEANGEVFLAVSCLDARDKPTVSDVEAAEPRFVRASPVFGRALAWGSLGCSDWPIKATHPQIDIDAKTSTPALIIGTTGDPATPYESAKSLARQLSSSVLLTRVGDGHTAYASGDDCVDDAVDRYLLSGKPPAKGTVCR
jgi:pimeloyl-ACP methyl ester carboxylesterase